MCIRQKNYKYTLLYYITVVGLLLVEYIFYVSLYEFLLQRFYLWQFIYLYISKVQFISLHSNRPTKCIYHHTLFLSSCIANHRQHFEHLTSLMVGQNGLSNRQLCIHTSIVYIYIYKCALYSRVVTIILFHQLCTAIKHKSL